jgi:hypothetical protein
MTTKKTVLVEFNDEVDCLLKYCHQNKIDIHSLNIVALSAKVQAYLNNKEIKYANTLEFFKNTSQEVIIKKSEEILLHFRKNTAGPNFLVEDFIFYLRFHILHYLWIIEILNSLKENALDSLIVIESKSQLSDSLFIEECERYVSVLSKRFCENHEIHYTIIKNDTHLECGGKKPNFIDKIVTFLGRLNFEIISKSSLIVALSLSYNFDKLIKQILNKNRGTKCLVLGELDPSPKLVLVLFLQLFNLSPKKNIFFLPVNIFSDKIQKNENLFPELRESFNKIEFQHRRVSFKKELEKKVEVSLISHLNKLNNQKRIVDKIYEETKPKMILSQIGIGLGRVLGESSLSQGIPSIFISHGSHKTPKNEIEYIELYNLCRGFMLSDFNFAAISSPFTKEHFDYFKVHYQEMPAQPLITGPLIYSKLDVSKKSNEKIILHATTLKIRGGDRFYFLETHDEFFSGVNDLIDIVDELDNVKLLLRFHPGFPLSEQEIRSLLKPSDKVIISLKGPFKEVLEISDVLVSYSSTAIEEALLNFIPVVLYDKWNRYNHLDASEIKNEEDVNCAYYATNKENLKNSIIRLLDDGDKLEKSCYYKYIYEEDYSSNFYDFVSKLLSSTKHSSFS